MPDIRNIGWDPYLDYTKITEEMTQDMRAAVVEQRDAVTELVDAPSAAATERLIKAAENVQDTTNAIRHALLTVPVMVHRAGPVGDELYDDDDPSSDEVKIQRCKRCKDILNGWREGVVVMTVNGPMVVDFDEVQWFDEDANVARSSHSPLAIYLIEGRELEPHERECVQMPDLDIPPSDWKGFDS